MQIIFDCERMKYPFTGLFEYCYQLGNALLAGKTEEEKIGFYIEKAQEFRFPKAEKFLTQKNLHKLIFPNIKDIQVWHSTYQTTNYLPRKKTKTKLVLTIHDLNFLHEGKSRSKQLSYLKKLKKNVAIADHIVAISEFTKNDLLKNLNTTTPITVIYNGCNVDFSTKGKPKDYVLKNPFIFALGTVIPKKNFHVLPSLLANNNYDLIIAGKTDANYIEKILQEAKKYNVENRVHIIGSISTDDKYWYYKNCLAFAFPSMAEGFGIPVIEAMKFGKPVFISTFTSLPEIGGDLAYYFKDFTPEHMQKTFSEGITDYQLQNRSSQIIAYAQKFDWKISAQAYLKIYRSLYGFG